MPPRVAVEDSLRRVKDRLRAGGFDVLSLSAGVPEHVVAIVVDGLDDRYLGRHDVVGRVPVIDASGRAPDDVLAEVGRRLRAAAVADL